MNTLVLNLILDPLHKILYPRLSPAFHHPQVPSNDALHALQELLPMEQSRAPKPIIPRPRAQRQLQSLFLHIHEAGILEISLRLGRNAKVEALGGGGAGQDRKVLGQHRGLGQGAVVTGGHNVHLDELEPAAGFEGAEGLGEEAGIVGDTTEHVAGVDEVVGGGAVGPF